MEPHLERTLIAAIAQLTNVLRDHKTSIDDLSETMRMLEAELEMHRGA